MNILVVHEVDWIRKVVYELHEIAELLSLRGHNVVAIDFEEQWERTGLLDFGYLRTKTCQAGGRSYPRSQVTLFSAQPAEDTAA